MTLEDRHVEVVVEDACAGLVCCSWQQDGVRRRSWVPADHLPAPAGRGDADR